MVIFGIVLTVVSAYVGLTEQQIGLITIDSQAVRSMQAGAGNLAYISSDYLQNRKNAQLTLWHNELSGTSSALSKLNHADPAEGALIDNINGDLQRLETTFNGAVLYVESIPKNETGIVHPLLRTYSNQLAVQNQALAFDITVLSSNLEIQATQARQTSNVLVLSLIGLFGAFFVAVYLLTFKRTLTSLTRLQKEIKVVGLGNLDHVIVADSDDEVGDLSRDFNQMTVDLKAVTASKAELENEITERKKAEEALKQNELTFLELIERAPFGIYVVNSEFRIEHMNKGSQDGAFRNVRPLIGRDFSEAMQILWPEPTASEILSHFRHTLQTGEPYYSPPFINPRLDVEIVEAYEWELQRIKLPNGQFGVICYYFDSTKLRETERGLSEAQVKLKEYATNLEGLVEERTKQLKDSERLAAIGATAGMVGHDIRNPLQAITSDVYLAKTELASVSDSDGKRSALESLEEIGKNTEYINKIVQDLQDYARPLNPKEEEADLQLIVEKLFAKNGLPENVKVNVKIENEAKKIRADSYYLNRILYNLTTNSIQAMPNGGKLTISAYKEANDTVIAVKDTGVGIPKEVQGKMFTLMFTTKSKGQGFGLPVVKRMTEALGGTVTFESEIGKGTKFIIRLPLKRDKR
jgi:signal transduction histidine kinase